MDLLFGNAVFSHWKGLIDGWDVCKREHPSGNAFFFPEKWGKGACDVLYVKPSWPPFEN
jgi:hypothetical protein